MVGSNVFMDIWGSKSIPLNEMIDIEHVDEALGCHRHTVII